MRMLILFYTVQLVIPDVCRCTQNLKTVALLGAEKSVVKNFIGEKVKKQK